VVPDGGVRRPRPTKMRSDRGENIVKRLARAERNGVNGGRSMFVRLGGRVGRLVSAVPNIERPDPVCRDPRKRHGRSNKLGPLSAYFSH